MDKDTIKSLALAHGFTLRDQLDGTEDLNPCVYSFAASLIEMAKKEAIDSPPTSNLTVRVAKMEESNGHITWTVFLSKDPSSYLWDCYQVYSDTIEGRARYVAAELEHFLGLGPEPSILDFEVDYVSGTDTDEMQSVIEDAERYRWLANDCDGDVQDDFIRWLSGVVVSKEKIDSIIDMAMRGTRKLKFQ